MSQLRDRLSAAQRRRAQPIGFSIGRSGESNRHMLVLAQGDGAQLATALESAIDGVLVQDAASLASTVAAANDRPVGLVSLGATGADATAAADAGADFLLIDGSSTHAAALLEERLGTVLRLDPPISEDELIMLRAAHFDALIVPATPRPVTVRAQMDLRRIHALSASVLLVEVAEPIDPETLRVWQAAGVHGVIAQGAALGQLPALLAAADEVPAPVDSSDRDGPSLSSGAAPQSLGLR